MTLRLVLLGDPVEHSRSPAIHQAALDHLGITGRYSARRVDAAGMARAVAEVRSGALSGANVTMPHKALAARLADRCEEDAARAGAVNTLVADGSRVVGHLTDVAGVRFAWEQALLPDAAPALVLGAGGAAAAALLALEGRELFVSARRGGSAAALVDRLEVAAQVAGWGEPVRGAVVVNATPLGMQGEPLPAALLEAAAGLLDMAYGAAATPAVAAARAADLPVADGPEMLLGQAMAAFELWTGRPAPEAPMRQALRAR